MNSEENENSEVSKPTPIQVLLTNFVNAHSQIPKGPPGEPFRVIEKDGQRYLESSKPLNLDGTFG